MEIAGDSGFDCKLRVGRGVDRLAAEGDRPAASFTPPLDVADACQQVRFDLRVLFVGDVSRLPPHLRCQQLVAQRGIVVHLGLGSRDDRVQHPAEPGHEEGVEDEHHQIPQFMDSAWTVRRARRDYS